MRILLVILRVLTAVLAVVGVIAEYRVNLAYWLDIGVQGIAEKTLDFALFFTIDANLFAAAVLLVGAVRLAGRIPATTAWSTVRLAATVYLLITGLVYNVMLRGLPQPPALVLEWANDIVHVAVPAFLLLDWLIAPDRRPLGAGSIGRVVIFPLVWIAVTLLRGPFTGDEVTGSATYYPYGFLDPGASSNGYLGIAVYVVVLAGVVCLVTAVLAWVSRIGHRAGETKAVPRRGAPAA